MTSAALQPSSPNRLGLVDMVVSLGDGSWHPAPYDQAAEPYNYSDMTGFNVRVVNPGLQPLKGYWKLAHDSAIAAQRWTKVSWNADLPAGCGVEAYVRASEDRAALGRAEWVAVTNNTPFAAIRGRYLELRLALTRDDAAKQPAIYDVTLHGTSSGFAGSLNIEDAIAYETQNATFSLNLLGAAPLVYQWFRCYPWETNWVAVAGETNASYTLTNVDFWLSWETRTTLASCLVSNGSGEALWIGPAYLGVVPLTVLLPESGSSGPASRYPLTTGVFGQPTNFNRVSVSATLYGLNHNRSADLSILLISPRGKQIMLMSNVGASGGVSGAIITFQKGFGQPPQGQPLSSGTHSYFNPSNYGQIQQMPRMGDDPPPVNTGTYSVDLDDLQNDDVNGFWKMYIYDNVSGASGNLADSWDLNLTFQ